MSDGAIARLRALAWPIYLAAGLLVVLPLLDLITNVWPARPGQLEWRFGTLGLLSGFTLTPLLGMILALAAAAVLEHVTVLRVLGVVNFVAAGVLVVAVPIFTLDWLQMRASAPPDALGSFDLGSVKSIVKHASVAGALVWLGLAAVRQRKPSGDARAPRKTAPIVRPPAAD